MKKKCFKCKKYKDLKEFYKHSQMADGYINKCKLCTKKDVKNRYLDPVSKLRIVEYERKRFKDPKRKEKLSLYQLKRRSLKPGKYSCNYKLTNAVRDGIIIKKPCEVCGNLKSQAHHSDYRSPLKVIWLCFKHHRELHGQKVI